ncbi:MAG: hypothetical protein WCA16_11100 [Candidatus Sulfotelmatobacter sp.]
MRIPQLIMGTALVVLVILLLVNSPRQRSAAYNVADEVAIQGTVQDVQDFYCPISGDEGTHLMVATENGTIQVHVAPKRFLRGNNWSFEKGDHVQVIGSKIRYEGHDAVVARTISRDNHTLAFRRSNGKPLWVE